MLVLCEVRVCLDALGTVLGASLSPGTVRLADSLGSAMLDLAGAGADVLLFDIQAGGVLSSVTVLQRHWPAIRLVAFGVESGRQAADCIAAGITTALPRQATAGELVQALGAAGASIAPRETAATTSPLRPPPVSTSTPPVRLTVREREVATLMAQGLTNKQIARRLDIALTTTKNHVHAILEKLQTRSRLQAVLRLGLPLG